MILFSVFKANNSTEQNLLSHKQAVRRLTLQDIKYTTNYSRFEGTDEFYIAVDDANLIDALKLCKEFKQDSYLSLVQDRAYIHDVDKCLLLSSGDWKNVPYRKELTDFTIIGDKCFVIES